MKELQRKQRIRRIVYSIPSLIILSIVAFFFTKGAVKIVDKELESSARVRDLEAEAITLMLREQELKKDIARLETEEGIKEKIKNHQKKKKKKKKKKYCWREEGEKKKGEKKKKI